MNIFVSPLQIIDVYNPSTNAINPKLVLLFETSFSESVKNMLTLLNDSSHSRSSSNTSILTSQSALSLSSSTLSSTNSETQLMQMVTATDGLELLLWYLNGIREYAIKRTMNHSDLFNRMQLFYVYVVDIAVPKFRRNISAVVMRNSGFLQLNNLKNQIRSCVWNLTEVTIEFHQPVVQIAKKSLEKLDKTLMNLQLKRSVMNEIYFGTWSYISHVLISAFASIRSCNGFGRSLMASDTKKIHEVFQFISKIEVDATKILEFVNAFFYQENEFSMWIENAPGKYKQKHIISLIKSGLNIKLNSSETKALIAKVEAKYQASRT